MAALESGMIDGIPWTREIPKGSPYLAPYAKLPAKEYEAIRFWGSGFYSFQRPWVFEQARFAHATKSRQIGFSHSTAGSICLWSVYGGEVTTVVSDVEESALETVAKVKEHARLLRKHGSEFARTVRSSDTEIVFASGGRVKAFTRRGARSFTGNLVLEEFAYHPDPDKVWDASAPVLTTGNLKMRVISTPNGYNAFKRQHDLAKEKGSGWAFYEVPIEVAVACGYPVNMEACWILAKNDPRLFAQMYQCSFLANVFQYIPHEKIQECLASEGFGPSGPGLYYGGLDIGETSDRTVLTIVRVYQGKVYPVHIESIARTEWDRMEAMVAWAFWRYRLKRLCIDKTGLGTFPAQKMQKLHGDMVEVDYRRNKVEMIRFGANEKEILATQLFSNIVDGTCRLPVNDNALPTFVRRDRLGAKAQGAEHGEPRVVNAPPDPATGFPGAAMLLQEEIASIQRVLTSGGNASYVSPKTKWGHGDSAWSLALALHAVDAVHPMVAALQARLGKTAA
jgi:phage FluMu gp28-like protein